MDAKQTTHNAADEDACSATGPKRSHLFDQALAQITNEVEIALRLVSGQTDFQFFDAINKVFLAAQKPVQQILGNFLKSAAGSLGGASTAEKQAFATSLQDILKRFDLRLELESGEGPREAILRCLPIKKRNKDYAYFVLVRRHGGEVTEHCCGATVPALRVVEKTIPDSRKTIRRLS